VQSFTPSVTCVGIAGTANVVHARVHVRPEHELRDEPRLAEAGDNGVRRGAGEVRSEALEVLTRRSVLVDDLTAAGIAVMAGVGKPIVDAPPRRSPSTRSGRAGGRSSSPRGAAREDAHVEDEAILHHGRRRVRPRSRSVGKRFCDPRSAR